eukprot:7152330-Pyramimonas_sp.AAC.1
MQIRPVGSRSIQVPQKSHLSPGQKKLRSRSRNAVVDHGHTDARGAVGYPRERGLYSWCWASACLSSRAHVVPHPFEVPSRDGPLSDVPMVRQLDYVLSALVY